MPVPAIIAACKDPLGWAFTRSNEGKPEGLLIRPSPHPAAAALGYSLIAALFASVCLAADERPNIIVILVDDIGFSDVGCYGGEIPTPHLDALAAGGLRFPSVTTRPAAALRGRAF